MLFKIALTFFSIILVLQHAIGKDSSLAQEDFSKMHMLLEKTIFNVDVLTVEIQVGNETQKQLKGLLSNHPYSELFLDQTTSIMLSSQDALVKITFLRDIDFDTFISETKLTVQNIAKSGVINEEESTEVSENLQNWFSPLNERGIKEGDELSYHVKADKMHTVFRISSGKKLINQVDQSSTARRAVIGSYFAPTSEFREALVRSLFKFD